MEAGVTWEFEGFPVDGTMRMWSHFTFATEKEARREFKKVHADYLKNKDRYLCEPVLYRVERTVAKLSGGK